MILLINRVTDQLVYCLCYQKFMNELFIISYQQFLNSILCGFRKAHNTQHPLFKLLHSWRRELDSGGFVGTILMDFSKAYDCISHELLIAKLEFYGLDEISLKLILNYLTHRKQRTKIGSSFSSCFDIYIGVPQGSIPGPLLFNIFINDLFLNVIKSEVCNFADDNTLYCFDRKLDTIFSNVKYDLENVLSWFQANSLKANPSKFQFMILGDKQNTSLVLNINGKKINNSREIELLGIVIDNQLKFKKHIEKLCKKASFKLHALRRIRKFLTVEKARILANAFINSQFNYAPLIWMFPSKTAINKILTIHYRTL